MCCFLLFIVVHIVLHFNSPGPGFWAGRFCGRFLEFCKSSWTVSGTQSAHLPLVSSSWCLLRSFVGEEPTALSLGLTSPCGSDSLRAHLLLLVTFPPLVMSVSIFLCDPLSWIFFLCLGSFFTCSAGVDAKHSSPG